MANTCPKGQGMDALILVIKKQDVFVSEENLVKISTSPIPHQLSQKTAQQEPLH